MAEKISTYRNITTLLVVTLLLYLLHFQLYNFHLQITTVIPSFINLTFRHLVI